MFCVADALDALEWVEAIGGQPATVARANASAAALQAWVDRTPWVDNLVDAPAARSNTSVCLKVTDPDVARLDEAGQRDFVKRMTRLLEKEGVAYDIGAHRDAPPGLRVWCGPTVDTADVEALTPWLDWAFATTRAA
jgi:phosphoserine aminotransferase